ncbi:FAD-dependent monooxygenase [Streptomyces sp. P38-E01]|uniref:FAD-dependent monooxygenase n=1 Tax=Streptomyces tardus TaxID=2780544 RepID=A0A949NA49_9ACTN|nr:FAD-dependent monooxygenase [Streptomyces tardus]MBU7600276.1 FAD-dependent monooxygenase [Streptomyces tardus]
MEPVIIVGAGPVGLALALSLARHEVPTVVLDAGDGRITPRPARSCVLRPDTAALVQRLIAPEPLPGARWMVWRTLRRGQVLEQRDFTPADAPLHVPEHTLRKAFRAAAGRTGLVRIVDHSKVVELEAYEDGVRARTKGEQGEVWRGSHLVGCDGIRSTVRKLLGTRFPGRTAVERHAVAALRVALPWPEEALLHREMPGGKGGEVCARALPSGVWRLDWLLPARGELVTPDALLERIQETLAAWTGEQDPAYELLDTGVHTAHQRLARQWRRGRVLLAGDAAHLLGALGTQAVDEGLRDVDNLAWKLALHRLGAGDEGLLDSYEQERRGAVVARLRAVDQALPLVRNAGALRTLLPGGARSRLTLLTDGHLGRGTLGAAPEHRGSPLTTAPLGGGVATEPGERAEDIPLTALDGTRQALSERLGARLLVVLVAPGTAVWDSRHWLNAGVMPELAAAVRALPAPAELFVTESYPGAAAHTVLVVRPDGYLAAALPGVHREELGRVVATLAGWADGRDRASDGGPPAGSSRGGGATDPDPAPGREPAEDGARVAGQGTA